MDVYAIHVKYIVDDPIDPEPEWATYYVLANSEDEAKKIVIDDLQKTEFFVCYDEDMNPIFGNVKKIEILSVKKLEEPQIIHVV